MLGCTTLEPQHLRSNVIALTKVATAFELPIVTTGGRPDDPFLPDVLDVAGPTRVHVDRQTIDAFGTPAFKEAIEQTGRRTLVIAGITTDLCVLLPAVSAMADGYDVHIVVDASACFTTQIEHAALDRLSQAGAALTTWAAFASELHRASNWPDGIGPQIYATSVEHNGVIGLGSALTQNHSSVGQNT